MADDYASGVPLGSTVLSWLVILALVLSVVALVLAAVTSLRRHGHRGPASRGAGGPQRLAGFRRRAKDEPLSPEEVTSEIQSLNHDAATALRHVAVIRYDAFGDMGGHLSWSVALLDDSGYGVVLTSIHGRSDSRTYAKNVSDWSSTQQLSPEEEESIRLARSPQ